MKPETRSLLDWARRTLDGAKRIERAGVVEVAAREAYMAAHRAAQAVLLETGGAVPGTHEEVQAAYGRLALEDARLGGRAGQFLARAYRYKQREERWTAERTAPEEAATAVAEADRFVMTIERALKDG